MKNGTPKPWLSIAAVLLALALVSCSSPGAKVVKHEVKKAVPGVDTKGEKISKKADRLGGAEEKHIERTGN